jgi:MFS family permease
LGWFWGAPAGARRALLAASLGWMLDAFDVLLYALLLPSVMAGLHMTKATAGLLGSLTLVAAAVGGVVLGLVADRWGRTRALMISVVLYAVFTAACGAAWGVVSLGVFRVLLGFGMGGEWAAGAALVSEAWPAESREKALAWMQSSFAVGYGLAALVVYALLPLVGWRGVFVIGVLPALFAVWVRRRVEEPAVWREAVAKRQDSARVGLSALFHGEVAGKTVVLTLMNACCLFAWWGFTLWVPSYLSLPAGRGGNGFSARTMTAILVTMQAGMWLGYVSFGYLATRFGRRRVYVSFLLGAAALLVVFGTVRSPWVLLALAPAVAFAGTGYFSGFGAVTAEVYPTRVRATGQAFSYNLGRLASAGAPYVAGALADRRGFGAAFHLDAVAFLVAAGFWVFLG